MISVKSLLVDKMYGGVVIRKVIWHGHDGVAYGVSVSAVFEHDIAFTGMFFTSAQRWLLAITNSCHSRF